MNTKAKQLKSISGCTAHSGVWYSPIEESYYITCVHGSSDGELYLESTFKERVLTTPDLLRSLLRDKLEINIEQSSSIIINPCYPRDVTTRWKTELGEHNIEVVGNWSEKTVCSQMSFIDRVLVVVYPISMINSDGFYKLNNSIKLFWREQ